MRRGVLYVIACAAPPSREVRRLILPAQGRGWDVCAIITPSARRFVDVHELETLTGHPVRSEYKEPGAPDVLPAPDALVVAPATVNTMCKWAYGISDTLPLGLLAEAFGKHLPVVALPFTNRAHAVNPAFVEAVGRLRSWGVRVLLGPDVYRLHEPGTGSRFLADFPWEMALDALEGDG